MAKNPVEEFLLEKKAFNFGGAVSAAAPYARRFAETAGMGAAVGIGGAGFAGLTLAAGKLYDAATKTRDYNRMLEANPDLAHHLAEDPEGFTRMFSAIRTMAPEYTQEPLVAGAYMRAGMESPVEERGRVPVQARRDRVFPKTGPLTEAAMGGFSRGSGMSLPDRKQSLVRQLKTTSGASGTPERIEETQNYYG